MSAVTLWIQYSSGPPFKVDGTDSQDVYDIIDKLDIYQVYHTQTVKCEHVKCPPLSMNLDQNLLNITDKFTIILFYSV
jgi:hypothetical protein